MRASDRDHSWSGEFRESPVAPCFFFNGWWKRLHAGGNLAVVTMFKAQHRWDGNLALVTVFKAHRWELTDCAPPRFIQVRGRLNEVYVNKADSRAAHSNSPMVDCHWIWWVEELSVWRDRIASSPLWKNPVHSKHCMLSSLNIYPSAATEKFCRRIERTNTAKKKSCARELYRPATAPQRTKQDHFTWREADKDRLSLRTNTKVPRTIWTLKWSKRLLITNRCL